MARGTDRELAWVQALDSVGEHRVDVVVSGKKPGGSDFTESQSLTFEKDIEPKLLAVTVAGREFGSAEVRIGSW